MLSALLGPYKIYIYAALVVVFLGLCSSTYALYLKNENKSIQITQLNKESKFWQDSYASAVSSHNEYVGKLQNVRKEKDKISTAYATKVEEIENAKIGNINAPLVVTPPGLQAFRTYSSNVR